MLMKNLNLKYFLEDKLCIKRVLAEKRQNVSLNRYQYFRKSWKDIGSASTFSFQK